MVVGHNYLNNKKEGKEKKRKRKRKNTLGNIKLYQIE